MTGLKGVIPPHLLAQHFVLPQEAVELKFVSS